MLNEETLRHVDDEIKRYKSRVAALRKRVSEDGRFVVGGTKESATVRRASIDLSNALLELRRRREW